MTAKQPIPEWFMRATFSFWERNFGTLNAVICTALYAEAAKDVSDNRCAADVAVTVHKRLAVEV